jgi:multicomponent Na+:H+ antiporter subunit G
MSQAFEIIDYVSWALLIAGSVFCVIGGIGIIRLPDFYCRTHGASITDTMGAGLILFGLILQGGKLIFNADTGAWQPDAWLIPVKLIFIGAFILLTSPTSGHALIKAAYADGLEWTNDEELENHADSE